MSRISSLVVGVVLGGAGIYGAFNYHVVKTDAGFELVRKSTASLSDTYVDIRNFGVSDWATHPALSADIVAAEKTGLLCQSASTTVQGEVRNLLNEIHR